jgi:hypothetical protein
LLGILLGAVCALGSCTARFESFPFVLSDGTKIGMREAPAERKEKEGILAPQGNADAATPLYTLVKPAAIREDGEAFSVSYQSTLGNCRLTIYSEDNRVLRQVSLPATSGLTFRLLVAMEKGSGIRGFQLSTESQEGALKLLGAGTAASINGFAINDDELVLDGSIQATALTAHELQALLSQAARERMTGKPWILTFALQPYDTSEKYTIAFTGDGPSDSRSFTVMSDPGRERVEVPAGGVGFVPREIRVADEGIPSGATATSKSVVRSAGISYVADDQPIPADPGMILEYDRSSWRSKDFEVFAWTGFPRVLIFDTADYDVQNDMFTRLAFFAEKPGYAGTILDRGDIEKNHGWNAHDYRAEDLGLFFTKARATGIALTPGESALLNILLENGIVTGGDTGYLPGEGAVLSISRSSSESLRRQLLTHECFHGVFFSLPGFRDSCEKIWSSLSGLEREVWLLFLGSSDYDADNQYLMVNEFQAYLFQQTRDKVGLFQASTIEKLKQKYPGKSPTLNRFQQGYPDSFLRSFDRLDSAIRAAGGPPGGETIAVNRTPSQP